MAEPSTAGEDAAPGTRLPPPAPTRLDAPPRPATADPAELGFRRRAMVRWFDPHQLLDTARRVVLSGMFGSYTDQREVQGLIPATVADRSGTELWFDYVADLGDGWNSTYTVARLLATEELTLDWAGRSYVTTRGGVLIMGGDQVYPVPTRANYENRFLGPYRSALPTVPDGQENPELFAIPGSHDWYDGLINFTSVFCEGRFIGGWRTRQTRSYFALKLPHGWWLWAIDIQFGSYIDDAQLNYYTDVARTQVRPGDRVILCIAKAVASSRDQEEICSDRHPAYLEREIIEPAGARVVLHLQSGRHHYCRYQEEGGPGHHIIAGGGGAFLHPTHHLPPRLDVPNVHGERQYRQAAAYPSPPSSRRLRKRVFLLPFYNLPLAAVFGGLYVLVGLILGLHLRDRHVALGVAALWHAVWGSSLLFLLLLIGGGVLAAMVQFAHGARHMVFRLVIGALNFSLQLAIMAGVFVAASRLSSGFGSGGPSGTVAFFAFAGVLGGLGASFAMSAYLWAANCLGLHDNEAYAPLHHMDYKHFVRLHVDADGALTVFPVAIDRVGRRWRTCPDAPPHAPWFAPDGPEPEARLIEEPIRFPGGRSS